MRNAWLLILLVGCMDTEPEPNDVVGPFTGQSRRFVVDAIEFPRNNAGAMAFGADLTGDGNVDNQLGRVIGTLGGQGNVTLHAGDMIAAGAVASSVQIVADDLRNDPTVSVQYVGTDGDVGVAVGGAFVDGAFVSNRTATTRVPGSARLRLPVFVDADPIVVELTGMEMELQPDGQGGFDAFVRGAVETAHPAAYAGIVQMLANDPLGHLEMLGIFDTDRDYAVSYREFTENGLILSLLAPDIEFAGRPALSFGFRVHLSPCASGRCAGEITDTCFDRVLDGTETDVDCGGSCRSCEGAASCAVAADCTSGNCDAGTCRLPTCTDGHRDGVETDVDCGSNCGACATGAQCWTDTDCANEMCGPRCTEQDPASCSSSTFQTCL